MNLKIKKIFFIGIILHLFYLCFLLVLHIFNFVHCFKNKNPYRDNVVYGVDDYDRNFINNNTTTDNSGTSQGVDTKVKECENKSTKQQQQLTQELEAIESIQTEINQLIEQNPELKDDLTNHDKYKSAQDVYAKIKGLQQENKFAEALNLLGFKQSLWQSVKSMFISSQTTLKDAFTTVLDDLKKIKETKNKQQQQLTQELEAIESIQTEINQLINETPELENLLINAQEFLINDKNYKQIQSAHDEIKKLQQENKFEEALNLLAPERSLWDRMTFTSKTTLKDAFKTVLNDLKTKKAKNKEQQQKLTEELKAIESIQTEINQLINETPELENLLINAQEFLINDKNYKQIQSAHDEIKKLQQENKFEEALNLLAPERSFLESMFTSSQTTLKDDFKTVLNNLKNIKNKFTDTNQSNAVLSSEEKKSWWSKITNLWPSVSAQPDNDALLQYESEKKIPALDKFFNEHPFVARILARCLGEKSTNLSQIISFLSRQIFEVTGKHVKNEVVKAEIEIPEKAKKAVGEHVTKIIIASVSSVSLLVTMIYWMVLKKRSSKNKIK
ncbi:hypothetical protein [Candidatus Phytoplasma meliae]|uniref:Uncharacterized protein n=1 Tax=Candidatus Phytoplasma meliae TaxID=1848402 RepID=A0ABS5CYT6_9MOLU|nr:hypothetical protein [Candidatus Phytoplasma meliae]MBP5836141.1 hypothetical protein [Candidatus Phytoplasma meliae]